jgi:hypothetical protein
VGKFAISVAAFTTSTSLTTAMGVGPNAAGETGEVVEVVMTGSGTTTAADTQHRCNGSYLTLATTGVSTTATPEPFHQGARASQFLAGHTYTTEPTSYSAQPSILFGFNQRGGMRWAVPQGEGLVMIGGFDDEGVGIRTISAAAGAVDGHLHFWEAG